MDAVSAARQCTRRRGHYQRWLKQDGEWFECQICKRRRRKVTLYLISFHPSILLPFLPAQIPSIYPSYLPFFHPSDTLFFLQFWHLLYNSFSFHFKSPVIYTILTKILHQSAFILIFPQLSFYHCFNNDSLPCADGTCAPHVLVDYEEVTSLSLSQRVALWLAADVFLLTTVREGLNLYPLEYICARRQLGTIKLN